LRTISCSDRAQNPIPCGPRRLPMR
jgi:hypothetical protein